MTPSDRPPAPRDSRPAGTGDPVHEDEQSVLADITGMIAKVLEEDGYGLDGIEIGMETRFDRDLELESIYLVALADLLERRYGSRINFAGFLAGLELDEIVQLTVGRLVEHVVENLKSVEAG